MIPRLLQLPTNRSYFLFGPRNTGKSTLINKLYTPQNSLIFNLLDSNLEDRFARNPAELSNIVNALPEHITNIVIDEIQKIPKLLDIIHYLIETTKKNFIMTGSSARKLKQGGANLLAGRAFVYHMHPFSFIEINEKFNLEQAMSWGMLPKIFEFTRDEDKSQFLFAYAHTYLKEEIWAEHFVQDLDPFRRFLEVAAQNNGKIISFRNISIDVGVDEKTIKRYYSILEDTMIGFFLETHHNSFRKRLGSKPKFYFFDTGVTRSLARMLSIKLLPHTNYYGEVFEHFVILESLKLASYYTKEYQFSYLITKNDVEIDLIVNRPGKKLLAIEIKSSDNVSSESIAAFAKLSRELGECEAVCFSNDPYQKMIGDVKVYPWHEGIKRFFTNQHPVTRDNV